MNKFQLNVLMLFAMQYDLMNESMATTLEKWQHFLEEEGPCGADTIIGEAYTAIKRGETYGKYNKFILDYVADYIEFSATMNLQNQIQSL